MPAGDRTNTLNVFQSFPYNIMFCRTLQLYHVFVCFFFYFCKNLTKKILQCFHPVFMCLDRLCLSLCFASNQINLYLYSAFHTRKYLKVPHRNLQTTAEKEKQQNKIKRRKLKEPNPPTPTDMHSYTHLYTHSHIRTQTHRHTDTHTHIHTYSSCH